MNTQLGYCERIQPVVKGLCVDTLVNTHLLDFIYELFILTMGYVSLNMGLRFDF
jgi:hypothetical protein